MIKRTWLEHGTKILGAVGGTLSAIAAVSGIIPPKCYPYIMGTISVLTFWRGFINGEILNARPDDTDRQSGV